MKKAGSKYNQLKQISTATLLEESGHLKLILKAVVTLAILIVLFIIWASIIKIKETALTYGELVPKGQVQLIQHLEGGIVSNVLVSNGQTVKKGQLLIKMKSDSVEAELAQLRSRDITLTLDSERLRAYLARKPANIVEWSQSVINSKYNTVKNRIEIQKLLEDEKQLLMSMNKSRTDQRAILQNTLAKRKEELKQATQQREVWKRHIKLLDQTFQMYEKLKKKSLISHKDYLVVLRDMNKAKGEYIRLSSEIKKSHQAIAESENKLKELDSMLDEKARNELGQVMANLLETRHKIQKLEERLTRLNIKSPIDGVVKGLAVFAGNVVKPGAQLVEVVPQNQELVVESRIQPRDIGHVKVGDPVVVKIMSYDFARYGSIKGKLTSISATTFDDEDGKPYYKATTSLEKQYMGSSKRKRMLKAGMTVEASIVTGEKTLLQYLLKPIHTTTGKAFRER